MMPGVVAGFPLKPVSGRTKISLIQNSPSELLFSDPIWGPYGAAAPEFGTIIPGAPAGEGASGQIHVVTIRADEVGIEFAGVWGQVESLPWTTFHFGEVVRTISERLFYQSNFGSTLIRFPGSTLYASPVTIEVWAE